MRQVQSAARAPANPSGADLKVAAAAAKQESAARAELRKENASESGSTIDASSSFSPTGESPEPTVAHPQHPKRFPAAYQRPPEHRSGDRLNLLA